MSKIWIAKNRSGFIFLFTEKPEKDHWGVWSSTKCKGSRISKDRWKDFGLENMKSETLQEVTIELGGPESIINSVMDEVEKYYGELPERKEIIESWKKNSHFG